MSASQIDEAKPIQINNAEKVPQLVFSKSLFKDDMNLSKMESEDTANIRLFYDDDVKMTNDDEKEEKDQFDEPKEAVTSEIVTPKEKTPRRVELRTLSTPKSKKRLL
jgi:chromatin assembly factor 1 subunit B